MEINTILVLSVFIFLIASLYSSVGQGGGSGYIAIMGLYGLSPELIRPIALILNVLVAGMSTVQFYLDRMFSWSNFYPFAITSCHLLISED